MVNLVKAILKLFLIKLKLSDAKKVESVSHTYSTIIIFVVVVVIQHYKLKKINSVDITYIYIHDGLELVGNS